MVGRLTELHYVTQKACRYKELLLAWEKREPITYPALTSTHKANRKHYPLAE